jgi:hypothetical protein
MGFAAVVLLVGAKKPEKRSSASIFPTKPSYFHNLSDAFFTATITAVTPFSWLLLDQPLEPV